MNDNLIEQKTIIRNYLDEVRKKLPHWVKDQRKDVQDIIDELEDHIWDKATELAQGQDPTAIQIQFVISEMGTPKDIAREYRHRGKPKIFITEELFPWYWKTLAGAGALSFVVTIITMIFSIGIDSASEIAKNFAIGLSLGLLITFNVVTFIFVGLSMQGLLPEDFKRITISRRPVQEQTQTTETRATQMTAPIAKRQFKFFRRGEVLIIGIIGIIAGLFLLTLPTVIFKPFMGTYITTDLIRWLAVIGILLLVASLIRLIQAIIGYRERIQQILNISHIVPTLVNIPFFIALYDREAILMDTLQVLLPGVEVDLLLIIFSVTIFCILGYVFIMDIIRTIMIGVKGFPTNGRIYQQ